jgi:hypothetical protein
MVGLCIGASLPDCSRSDPRLELPLLRGMEKLDTRKLDRGNEGKKGRAGKKIDRGSTHSDGECRWKMQSQGKTLEIRTTPRYYLCDDERNDSLGCHEC